ncbi:MAG: dihydrolipoyl dehydrogenase, partial [Sphaerochaetaceae bacterium]|nr:dihydrolipoyl dehydrogenase [Sphaerochaetaceae bacterium]
MKRMEKDLIVLGGGPGGYTAAFRAADLGRTVTIINEYPALGGVCLNVGCIPSKTLLHLSQVVEEADALRDKGVLFQSPQIDLDAVRSHKDSVVSSLNTGLAGMAKARKVEVMIGTGRFVSNTELSVNTGGEELLLTFKDIIIATGSRPVQIPLGDSDDERIWDSTDALALRRVPEHLLIIGGGIIGLEMADVYHTLGSKITIVEMLDEIIPAADKDLKQPLVKKIRTQYEGIYTQTKVVDIKSGKDSLEVVLEGEKAPSSVTCDVVLVSVGRRANSDSIGLETTDVTTNERGWISVNDRMETGVPGIYAIGDVTGDPMLAHRATHMGRVASEVASGHKAAFTPLAIPSVAYTHPEIAWIGLSETEAKQKGIAYTKGSFPWQASGRALSEVSTAGVSKALFDEKTGRLIGAGIAGKHAGELIGEAVLALEMGATAEDL